MISPLRFLAVTHSSSIAFEWIGIMQQSAGCASPRPRELKDWSESLALRYTRPRSGNDPACLGTVNMHSQLAAAATSD